jgi:hypothetical protein
LSLMQRASSDSIHTRGWSIFCKRRLDDALRLLAPGFRRLVENVEDGKLVQVQGSRKGEL